MTEDYKMINWIDEDLADARKSVDAAISREREATV